MRRVRADTAPVSVAWLVAIALAVVGLVLLGILIWRYESGINREPPGS